MDFLDALISAGWGDVSRGKIPAGVLDAAMSGQSVPPAAPEIVAEGERLWTESTGDEWAWLVRIFETSSEAVLQKPPGDAFESWRRKVWGRLQSARFPRRPNGYRQRWQSRAIDSERLLIRRLA